MQNRRPGLRPRPQSPGTRTRRRHAALRSAAPRHSLLARLAARTVIGVLVPLLGVTWLVGSSEVTLQVDGTPQTLTTHARSVDELLDRAGVAYSDHDEVVPAPDTPLRDGMVVEVVHAHEITLLIGGESETILVTALSVDDVVAQLAKRRDVTERSTVRPSRLTPVSSGMTVEIVNPAAVTVVADGKTRDVVTDATTVGGVLQGLGITLDRDDRVTPASSAPVKAGARITVERVRIVRQRQEVSVPFSTQERPSDDLAAGEQREIVAGRTGVVQVTDKVTFVDGVEVLRVPVRRRVVTSARDRVVEVGTAAPTEPRRDPAPASRSRTPSEPAPQPKPKPEPEPAPQPDSDSTRSQSGQASYYHHPEEGMTAAHRTLPFGTVVTVTNQANGKSVKVTINDRGPYIDGRIIDLNEMAFTQIAAKSTGVINVRITW